ncbi:1520_t:CDS:1, partial [Dentiscutata heterogama]
LINNRDTSFINCPNCRYEISEDKIENIVKQIKLQNEIRKKRKRNITNELNNLKIEDFDKKREDEIKILQTNIKRRRTRLMNEYKKNLANLNNDEQKQIDIIKKKYIQKKADIDERIKKRENELKLEDNFEDVIEEEITAKRQRRNTEDIVILDEEIRNN